MLMVDGRGTPIGLHVESASPAEVKLLEATLDSLDIPGKKVQPQRLVADKAYDSNKARQLIEGRGMLPIIPARENNTRATHQDGRHLPALAIKPCLYGYETASNPARREIS